MNTVTYNIELKFKDPQDKAKWTNLLSTSREAWNDCAQYLFENDIPLNIKEVHNNVYDWMRKTYDTLPAQAIIRIYKEVIASLRTIKSNKQKPEDPPFRKYLSMRIDKRLYSSLNEDGINLSGIRKGKKIHVGFILFPKVRELFQSCETSDPLVFERDGRLFLSVPFIVPTVPTKNETCIGIDMGIRRFITTSEGKCLIDRAYNGRRRNLRYLKRQLQSKGTKSARKHLKRLRRKEYNSSKNQMYLASKFILNSTKAGIIVMEDLTRIKKETSRTKEGYKKKGHNRRISQVPFYKFREIMTYKAQLAGKRVETVSPTWTSQIDSRTGKRDGIRKGCRYYCSDNQVLDADWNAAVNIGQRSKHPVSKRLPIDGKLLLTGRLNVNQPIVSGVQVQNACS